VHRNKFLYNKTN